MLFQFEKRGPAAFLSHLDLVRTFERAFVRAGLAVRMSQGFNPKSRLQFANPLSVGMESADEIGEVHLVGRVEPALFVERVNQVLPAGLRVAAARHREVSAEGAKTASLMSLFWGAEYAIRYPPEELVAAFEQSAEPGGPLWKLQDAGVVAVHSTAQEIVVTLRQSGGETRGMKRIMQEIWPGDPAVWVSRVVRLKSYRRVKNEGRVRFIS